MRYLYFLLMGLMFSALACNLSQAEQEDEPTIDLATPSPAAAVTQALSEVSDCEVVNQGGDQNVFAEPDGNSEVVGQLRNGAETYAYALRDGWWQVEIPETGVRGWYPRGLLYTETLQNCYALPVAEIETDYCAAVVIYGDAVGLFSEPNPESVPSGRAQPGMSFRVQRVTPDWVQVLLNFSRDGMDGLFWLRRSETRLDGACDSFSG